MPSRTEHAALWIGQLFLAAIFLTASYVKTSTPADELRLALPWTADLPMVLVRLIGVFEGLGGLGLVLPALFRVRPGLTPLAAGAVAVLMFSAALFHFARGEPRSAGSVLFLALLASSVSWGRVRHAPIRPRADDLDDGPDEDLDGPGVSP
jgi:uncharacterized membrane protein YphA (DoxX/SURF4 family)